MCFKTINSSNIADETSFRKPRNEHIYVREQEDIWKNVGNEKSVTKIHLHGIGCLTRALAFSCPSKTSISGMRTYFKFQQEFCSVTFQNASAVGQTMHVTTAGVQRASLVPHVRQVTRAHVQWLMIHSQSMWEKSVTAYGSVQYSVLLSVHAHSAVVSVAAQNREMLAICDTAARDMTQSSLVEIYRRFGGPLCLRLLNWRRHFPLWVIFYVHDVSGSGLYSPSSRDWL
jgi:hypothetical protein